MAKNRKGIIRKIDSLGRLVIPVELYRRHEIYGRDVEVEIISTDEGILVKKCEPKDINGDIRTIIEKYEYDGVNTETVKELKKLIGI